MEADPSVLGGSRGDPLVALPPDLVKALLGLCSDYLPGMRLVCRAWAARIPAATDFDRWVSEAARSGHSELLRWVRRARTIHRTPEKFKDLLLCAAEADSRSTLSEVYFWWTDVEIIGYLKKEFREMSRINGYEEVLSAAKYSLREELAEGVTAVLKACVEPWKAAGVQWALHVGRISTSEDNTDGNCLNEVLKEEDLIETILERSAAMGDVEVFYALRELEADWGACEVSNDRLWSAAEVAASHHRPEMFRTLCAWAFPDKDGSFHSNLFKLILSIFRDARDEEFRTQEASELFLREVLRQNHPEAEEAYPPVMLPGEIADTFFGKKIRRRDLLHDPDGQYVETVRVLRGIYSRPDSDVNRLIMAVTHNALMEDDVHAMRSCHEWAKACWVGPVCKTLDREYSKIIWAACVRGDLRFAEEVHGWLHETDGRIRRVSLDFLSNASRFSPVPAIREFWEQFLGCGRCNAPRVCSDRLGACHHARLNDG